MGLVVSGLAALRLPLMMGHAAESYLLDCWGAAVVVCCVEFRQAQVSAGVKRLSVDEFGGLKGIKSTS